MHIVLLEPLDVSEAQLNVYADRLRARGHTFAAFEKTQNLQQLQEEVKDADVILTANMPLPWEAIRHADKLKYIDVAFTGTDHIPVRQASEKGIQVSNCSGYATDSVAELCIGLMIDLLRSIPQTSRSCRQAGTKNGWLARLLKGKTVGFAGAGHIASSTARLAKAFGARTIGYRRHPQPDDTFDIQAVDLEDLLTQSDIVSLHTPLTEATRHMISRRELQMMKPDALLINTARGPVVDTEALVEALEQGTIAGAALDVFDTEPPLDPDMPLLSAPNLLVTPHIGYYTRESMDQRAQILFDNLDKWLSGTWQNQVRP